MKKRKSVIVGLILFMAFCQSAEPKIEEKAFIGKWKAIQDIFSTFNHSPQTVYPGDGIIFNKDKSGQITIYGSDPINFKLQFLRPDESSNSTPTLIFETGDRRTRIQAYPYFIGDTLVLVVYFIDTGTSEVLVLKKQ